MSGASELFDYLIYAAIAILAAGLLLLIVDVVSGFRFIKRYPFIGEGLEKAGKPIWLLIGIIVAIAVIFGPTPEYDETCVLVQTRDGREVIC